MTSNDAQSRAREILDRVNKFWRTEIDHVGEKACQAYELEQWSEALTQQSKCWPNEKELSKARAELNPAPDSAQWARGFYACYKWLSQFARPASVSDEEIEKLWSAYEKAHWAECDVPYQFDGKTTFMAGFRAALGKLRGGT